MKVKNKKFKLAIFLIILLNLISCSINNLGDRYYENGIEAIKNKEYTEAVKYFELAIISKNKELKNLKKQNTKKEDEIIKKEIEISNAFYHRGFSYKELKNYDEAVKDYSVAIKLNNRFSDAYAERSIAYFQLGFIQRSIKDMSTSIELDPYNSNYYYNRARIFMEQQNFEDAIKDFSTSIKLNGSFPYSHYNRAECYRNIDKYKQAIKDYKNALILLNDKELIYKSYVNTGKCYYKIKQLNKAKESFLESLNYSENPYISYLNLSILYDTANNKEFGDLNTSIEYALEAVKNSEYNNVRSLKLLAFLYYKKGSFTKAFEIQKYALKLEPNNKEITDWYEIYKNLAE